MSDDSSFASDDTIDREMYGECPGELKPGDVIMYFSPVFVFGNKEGLRVAQVLCTEPKTESPLVLSSTESLPSDIRVKIIGHYDSSTFHPSEGGGFAPISSYKMTKQGNRTNATQEALARQGAIFSKILKAQKEKMVQEIQKAGGMVLGDILFDESPADNTTTTTAATTARTANATMMATATTKTAADTTTTTKRAADTTTTTKRAADTTTTTKRAADTTTTMKRAADTTTTTAAAPTANNMMAAMMPTANTSSTFDSPDFYGYPTSNNAMTTSFVSFVKLQLIVV